MTTDLSKFNPADAQALFQEITSQVSSDATAWWNTNSSLVAGYIKSLSEAAIQTQLALAEGRINQATATQILDMQKNAFTQTLQFAQYMTLALAQQIENTVFTVIGWAIYNKTGFNLFPLLVKPKPATS
jgi:hypothetical protein